MYFLYFLILCYTSTLLTPVNSYVVIAANVNDFRTIAKKFVPKDLVYQIKALVLENGHKYYREPTKDDEELDRTVEYEGISKHDENSYELAADLKAALTKQLTSGYKFKRAPQVAFVEPLRQVTQFAAPTAAAIPLNDIVQKVTENLLKEIFESGNVLGNTLADKMQSGSSQVYNNIVYKYATPAKATQKIKTPVYNSVPMKVIKEEVQFEATYEDTDDKPQMQDYSHYYKPVLNKSSVNNNNNLPFIYAKNTLSQKNGYDGAKKVRFVKQVLVPSNSNQGQSIHVSQSDFVQQPSISHQSNIVQHSNLETQLNWHKAGTVQQPVYQQSNIAQQLALMQQQIDQLTKNAQNIGLKRKPALQTPHLNIEAIDAHFHILPHQSVKVDENKTNDSQEDHVEPTEDTLLSEETTAVPAVTETSTKTLTVSGEVENEQFVEEDSAISMENEEEATEKKSEEITEINSNEDEHDLPILHEVKVDNNVRVGSETKVHTQEFGNPNVGEPIVEKTYNFDAPTNEAEVPPVHINIPASSARKVMLF